MSRRINVMIDEDTWRFLEKVPSGERSQTINEALRSWVSRRRRKDAVNELNALSSQLPKVSGDEVARWVRDDRARGH